MNKKKPLLLVIMDGWGYSASPEHNAIASAKTPYWDKLWSKYPHILLEGSGNAVGLPQGQMGNSEVGHINLGSGRIVYQDSTRIDKAIETGEFFENKVLLETLNTVKRTGKTLHLLGLLSPGGVHSHENHLWALLELAVRLELPSVKIHAFLDGRDTPPKSAEKSLAALEHFCHQHKGFAIASLIGRYYAMDRDKRWDRVKKAYDLLTEGLCDYTATSALEGLHHAYAQGESDEFVKPVSIGSASRIQDGDAVIFTNFRADRARELSQALTEENFTAFHRGVFPTLSHFTTFTQYSKEMKAEVAFPPSSLNNIFGDIVSKHHLTQLRIAETEKYAHVTFFFNGGREEPFPGEDRILIPSAKVSHYDLKPEMQAYDITEKIEESLKHHKHDVIICNFANPDMVGHTGNFDATVKAIEVMDDCIGRLMVAIENANGEMLITADHGNAELMFDEKTGQAHTAHTCNPVPLVYFGNRARFNTDMGILSDIAPTLLTLLGLDIPQEMTGKSLLSLQHVAL